MSRIQIGILGATGMVGQRFIQLLHTHPLFEIGALTGSERTAGRTYGEAGGWRLDTPMPASVRDMPILPSDASLDTPLVFSALPSNAAEAAELRLAQAGHIVCSNASTFRMTEDVPLLIPEVNPDHLELIHTQRKRRGWSGAIITNPNCTSTPATMVFRALLDAFGLRRTMIISMQALSGAGYPGVPSYDMVDNVIPYIGGEEPKVEREPQKMLGTLHDGQITPAAFVTSAMCNRVPVLEGHLECISVELERRPPLEDVIAVLREFRALPQELRLPTAPSQPIVVLDGPDRPQIRRDRDTGNGMSTVVGRVRECPILGYKLVVLGHNTLRGAAGGSVLNAELLVAQGYLG
ncbi:MAG: aspartate-semialdehyde dehydrogenase [Chloroflexaceae bacterium]|nr:aspartate-semialdehyde dehydrogenase [Chloroflexaceae bacterium]